MLTHGKKVCNPFWGSVISRKSIDIYRYALTGWGEEWGTIGVIWPCVNGIVSAMSVRKGGWNLENGVSSTSLRNPWVLRFDGSSSSDVNSQVLRAVTAQFGSYLCEYSLQSAGNLVEEH